MASIPELYKSLVGISRSVNGELTISGFSDADYEQLYDYLLEELSEYINGNYEFWYTTWSRRQHRKKARGTTRADFYDPHFEKHVFDQTIREQLVTIKFFLERRSASRYAKK